MKNIIPVKIKICPSLMLKGEVGLFAARNLKKGEIIGEADKMGEINFFKWSDIEGVDQTTRGVIESFCLGDADGFSTLDDMNYMSLPWFMNHSCDGSVGFDDKDNFVALRDITANEELSWDYGLGETNPNFKMNCMCGSEKCRNVITGNDWKDPAYKTLNNDHMLSILR